MQIRDPPHRQPRKITHDRSRGLRERDRQCADGRRLIHDEQHEIVAFCRSVTTTRRRYSSFGQRSFVELLAGAVEGDDVVFAFADLESDEHVDMADLSIWVTICPSVRSRSTACGGASRHPRYELPRACSGLAPVSDHSPPTRPGDNTLPDHQGQGDQSCRALQAATAQHGR